MRNKIKEIIKKEEGFTLVELLAVIVILGIIVAIAIPAVGNITKGAKIDADEAEIKLVTDAARLYDIENTIPDEGVTVEKLVKEGYLELRGEDKNKLSGKVVIQEDEDGNNKYVYEK